MWKIAVVAGSLALWGCESLGPYAGLGIGTSVGNVHLGTGVSFNPLTLLRRAAPDPAPDPPPPRRLTPIREFIGPTGQPCRDFREDRVVGGRHVQSEGTACLQPDGSWVIVSG